MKHSEVPAQVWSKLSLVKKHLRYGAGLEPTAGLKHYALDRWALLKFCLYALVALDLEYSK